MNLLVALDEFLISHIAKFLNFNTFIALSQCGKQLNKLLNNEEIWSSYFREIKEVRFINNNICFHIKHHYAIHRCTTKELIKEQEFIFCIHNKKEIQCHSYIDGTVPYSARKTQYTISAKMRRGLGGLGASAMRFYRLHIEKCFKSCENILDFIIQSSQSQECKIILVLPRCLMNVLLTEYMTIPNIIQKNLLRVFECSDYGPLVHDVIERCVDLVTEPDQKHTRDCAVLHNLFNILNNDYNAENWKFGDEALEHLKQNPVVLDLYIFNEIAETNETIVKQSKNVHIIKDNGLSCVKMFKCGFGGIAYKLEDTN